MDKELYLLLSDTEFHPVDSQKIWRMLEALIAAYRISSDGVGARLAIGVDEISAEWERQKLPCRVEKHVQQHNLDEYVVQAIARRKRP